MLVGLLPLIFASTTLALLVVYNHCPTIINVYNKGVPLATLPPEVSYSVDVTDAVIYTSVNAEVLGLVRAVIAENYYYVIAQGYYTNTGIQVVPIIFGRTAPEEGGYCVPIVCDSIGCDQAYLSKPGTIEHHAGQVPKPPLYQCPPTDDFEITFCPSGQFPDVVFIFGPDKCLQHSEGATVQIADCNNSPAQNWLINPGSTAVRASGTNMCLDASPNPYEGHNLTLNECDSDRPGQQWFYTDDYHIALKDQGFCLDVPDGDTTKGLRIWTCVSNSNQVWVRHAPFFYAP